MYEQTIVEGTVNSVMNCFWNTHTLLYLLNQRPTEPYTGLTFNRSIRTNIAPP